MTAVTQPRLPLEPLAKLIDHADLEQLARALGCTDRTIDRWQTGGIPLYSADEAATAAGLHPMNVWGDDWLIGIAS